MALSGQLVLRCKLWKSAFLVLHFLLIKFVYLWFAYASKSLQRFQRHFWHNGECKIIRYVIPKLFTRHTHIYLFHLHLQWKPALILKIYITLKHVNITYHQRKKIHINLHSSQNNINKPWKEKREQVVNSNYAWTHSNEATIFY